MSSTQALILDRQSANQVIEQAKTRPGLEIIEFGNFIQIKQISNPRPEVNQSEILQSFLPKHLQSN